MPSDTTTGNGHKLKHRRYRLNFRKRCYREGDPALAQATREVTSLSILKIDKSHPDTVLGNWLWTALLEQGRWTSCPPEIPPQKPCCCNSLPWKSDAKLSRESS